MSQTENLAERILFGGAVITANATFDINHSKNYVERVYNLIQSVLEIPLDQLMDEISTAEAIGPMLDPTTWRNKGAVFDKNIQVLRMANRFRASIIDFYKISMEDLEKEGYAARVRAEEETGEEVADDDG